jgi:hypothetical protein
MDEMDTMDFMDGWDNTRVDTDNKGEHIGSPLRGDTVKAGWKSAVRGCFFRVRVSFIGFWGKRVDSIGNVVFIDWVAYVEGNEGDPLGLTIGK